MDNPDLGLPTRDTLSVIAHRDQRAIKFFEQLQVASTLIGTAWIIVNDGNEIETGEPVLIIDLA